MFLGKEWAGLDVEASDPEIGCASRTPTERDLDTELVELGRRFAFGGLRPVKLVDLEYQIAQKLHAVTDPAYERAHDLVDLQLLWVEDPDLNSARDWLEHVITAVDAAGRDAEPLL